LKGKILMAIKIAVSLASLVIVIRTVDVSIIAKLLREIDAGCVVLALGIFWVAQIVSSLRCVYVAHSLGEKLELSTSVRAHFVGLWFNQVLPTSLGGDFLKIAILRKTIGLGVAIRSTILDRFSGLFLMMLAIALTLPLYTDVIFPQQQGLTQGLGVLSLSFLFGTIILAWSAVRLRPHLAKYPFIQKSLEFVSDIWRFRKGAPLWRQMWTSAVVHFNGIAAYALLSVALGLHIDMLVLALIVPLVFLAALLPISFAGWGVREVGAIWLFGLVDVAKENALALSIAYGLMLIVAGVPGLLLSFHESVVGATETRN